MATAINPDEHAAILRVASYHRRDYDVIVVRSNPREHAKVQPFISEAFTTPASSSLGSLGRLPSEVLADICSYLDVLSSFKLREVNRLARQVVSASPAYRNLSSFAMDSLRTPLRTGIANWLLISDLHRALCNTECAQCGEYGPLLFVSTVQRCCYRCLDSSSYYRMLSISALAKASRVSPGRLRQLLPVFHTIPGKYGLFGNHYKQRLSLVPVAAIPQCIESRQLPNFQTSMPEPLGGTIAFRSMTVTALPSLDRASATVQDGVSCKGCQVALEKDESGSLEFHDLRDLSYTREGFLVHFKSCEEARNLWRESHGGTVSPREPQATKTGGFISERLAEQFYK